MTGGAACHNNEVGLGQLAKDLKSASTTPSLSYIIPAPCNDGSEAPCRAARRDRARRRQPLPEVGRARDQALARLQGRRADRDHVRPGARRPGQYADPSACCASPASYPNLRGLPAGRRRRCRRQRSGTRPRNDDHRDDHHRHDHDRHHRRPDRHDHHAPTTTTPPRHDHRPTRPPTNTTRPRRRRPPPPTRRPRRATTTTAPVSLGGGETTPTGGGGQVGLLLISPYVKANSTDVDRLLQPLLAAGDDREPVRAAPARLRRHARSPVFSTGVFNNYAGSVPRLGARAAPRVRQPRAARPRRRAAADAARPAG